MPLLKLSSTDAFVVTDVDEAPATGLVRTGKKILQSSAKDLARSISYTFASFEIERSGASAGINAVGDAVRTASEAFCDELGPRVADGDLHFYPGKGTAPNALSSLVDETEERDDTQILQETVAGIVAAARWASDSSLDGTSIAIEGTGVLPEAIAAAVVDEGGTLVEVDGADKKPWLVWSADADLIFVGSKPGVLSHQGSPNVKAKAVVPWGPIPYTTKAIAELNRSGVVVVPDFLSLAGALIPRYIDAASALNVRSVITDALEASSHPDGVLLGSCYRAEAFMSAWLAKPLFGRPFAA